MKRVVITGATGFVGANLAERLVKEGHAVYLLARKGRRLWRIENLLAQVQLTTVDFLDRAELLAEIDHIRPDWIFHLAAYGAYSWQADLDAALETNFLSTVNLVEASRQVGFEAFINTGSSSEYGRKSHAAREDDVLEPNSYYAVTKVAGTLFCRYTAQRFKLPLFTLRLYSVYGPYEEPGRLIPKLITRGLQGELPALAHPDTARDFIFAEDVTDAYTFLATRSNVLTPGEIYNAGTGKQTSLREAVQMTREVFHISTEPIWGSMEDRSWDTDIWLADNGKLCKMGWAPNYGFRTGYLKTIEWFRQNPLLVEKFYARL